MVIAEEEQISETSSVAKFSSLKKPKLKETITIESKGHHTGEEISVKSDSVLEISIPPEESQR